MVDGKNDWFTEMRLFSVESEYHLALFPAPKLACNAIGDSLSQYDVLEAVGEFGEAIMVTLSLLLGLSQPADIDVA